MYVSRLENRIVSEDDMKDNPILSNYNPNRPNPLKHGRPIAVRDFLIDKIKNFNYHFIVNDILPYRKIEGRLNEKQLLDVLYVAKKYRWKVLDLRNYGIPCIPEEIGELADLMFLAISDTVSDRNNYHTQVDELPEQIFNLSKLIVLKLNDLNLKQIPPGLDKLTDLLFLDLSYNTLTNFSEEIFKLNKLIVLRIGYIVSNTFISPEIGNLKRLEQLHIRGFGVTSLPDEIGRLSELNILSINDTNITQLPDSIHNLQNLKKLTISNTPVFELNEGIGDIRGLAQINISKTQISDIPKAFRRLNNINYFSIDKTPLSQKLPPEILNQQDQRLLDYILKLQDDKVETSILCESKMLIVGQAGVGKTCLLHRLIDNEYVEMPVTEGIFIEPWQFNKNNKDCNLSVWDFGGQEIYHATHQFFLTKRSLYIFVWDSRQDDEYGRIDYWLNTIESFAGDCPIIIVVNKCDYDRKNRKIIDIELLQKRFPQIIDVFYISCKDNYNIKELREQILETASELPLMETVWFSSWINVRQRLKELSKAYNIIDYKKYLEICLEYSIREDEALSLIQYLNDLGVLLYFHEDALLKHIVILVPEWATDAVYKILDSGLTLLKDRNGILEYSDLRKIWKDSKKYPEFVYHYILKLMQRFQLSFEITTGEKYLVAELLENKRQRIEVDFERDLALSFRYKYDFLPAGIMTRFIVATHKYLMEKEGKKTCWLKGAYLTFEGTVALVELYDGITQKFIDIKIKGKNSRIAAHFMTILRENFKTIHNSIPNLKFNELVQCNCSIDCTHFFNYATLLRFEENNRDKIPCEISTKDVSILSILNGISTLGEQEDHKMQHININISNNNTANASNNTIYITNEIRDDINLLQGYFNALKEEMSDIAPEIRNEVEKTENKLEELNNLSTKQEIVKNGGLYSIGKFIKELGDSSSNVGKIMSGLKYGYSLLQTIAEKYNSIAEWCGLPGVTDVLKKITALK